MGGIELAARLSVERPGVAVVLMTADPASAEEARRHPELVTAVLVKPFAIEELLAAVDDALAPR
jgi:CheY-like chemotaxis protein